MRIYDITRPISPTLAVWPGDTPYTHTWTMRIANGESVNLSTITLSAHTGTHADAPYHFDDQGVLINAIPLSAYIGRATVLHLPFTGSILPEHIAGIDLATVERLLIRTPASDCADDQWHEAIAYPVPETAALLGRHGVRLFGSDAPSVDPLDSKTLDGHHALYRQGIAILENLQLRDVPPGQYELIALPLHLPTDGSPVRAILRTLF
jgi:arylformamidase